MSEIATFRHHAMATYFEVRIAESESAYAAQAAQAVFDLVDGIESQLSRFRANSDVARLASLRPGETMRLSEHTFACLQIAQRMERLTGGAFSATPSALSPQAALSPQTALSPPAALSRQTALSTPAAMPRWTLVAETSSLRCEEGVLQMDLGAVGKGFALDCAGDLLRTWDCDRFLVVAGGSSVLAGEAPLDVEGWVCGVGEGQQRRELFLAKAALSGSGLAVKGSHILDPRTGGMARRTERAWALTEVCAESDTLSTACMVLSESEIDAVLAQEPSWVVYLEGETLRQIGA